MKTRPPWAQRLRLSRGERRVLTELLRAGRTGVWRALRARAVLLAAAGAAVSEIARQVGRDRKLGPTLAGPLCTRPPRGAPERRARVALPSFPPEERHEVVALACQPLGELAAARTQGPPPARRGGDDLRLHSADGQQEHGGPMAEGRCPQAASRPAVAAQPGPRLPPEGAPRRPLVSAPAARPSGALRGRENAGPGPGSAAARGPMRPGHLERLEDQYRRHGTLAVLAGWDVRTGRVVAVVRRRRRGQEFLQLLRRLRRVWPRGRLVIILDNLSIHTTPAVRAWTRPRMAGSSSSFCRSTRRGSIRSRSGSASSSGRPSPGPATQPTRPEPENCSFPSLEPYRPPLPVDLQGLPLAPVRCGGISGTRY